MEIVISVAGGLGMFLYGMNLMGDALQRTAGDKLKKLVEIFTSNIFTGVLMGMLVTFVIQSSSATTVMVIGFVNAGIMTLTQATGVIMGANIGTTVTSQIIAFDIMGYTPLMLGVGVAIYLFAKRKRVKDVAEIFVGLGIIFAGMAMMKNGLAPLGELPFFQTLLTGLNNPIAGLIVGFAMTTIIQSSSAAIGILQALSAQGLTIGMAVPILCGDNIGTTTTALLSSVGASKTAKRAAVIHFLFNLIGTVLFILVLRFPVEKLVFALTPDNASRQIANAHTLFNVINVLVQLPFYKFLVRAAERIVPGDIASDNMEAKFLDRRLLDTPFAALSQVKLEIQRMAEIVRENLNESEKALVEGNIESVEKGYQLEKSTNKLQREITDYLVQLSKESLSAKERVTLNSYLNIISDIERIGDHCENILEMAERKREDQVDFSGEGKTEMLAIYEKCIHAFRMMEKGFENTSETDSREVLKIEDEVDVLEKTLRENHISRLNAGKCSTMSGIIFLDVISNLERISDHCSNIALFVLDNFK